MSDEARDENPATILLFPEVEASPPRDPFEAVYVEIPPSMETRLLDLRFCANEAAVVPARDQTKLLLQCGPVVLIAIRPTSAVASRLLAGRG